MFRIKSMMLLCAMVVVLVGCKKEEPPVAPPTEVDVMTVKNGKMVEYISAVSSVIAMDSVDLVARVEGYLKKRNFTEGQAVKKGDLLFEIEPEIYEANVKSAQAGLEQAHAALKNAEIDYERQKTLVTSKAVSERAFDEAKTKKLECEAKVKDAEAKLATEKQNLSYTKVYSPFDGWVGLAPISEGNMVNLQSGTLAEVVKTDSVRVEFVLNELDLLHIMKYRDDHEGEKLKIRLFYQDGTEYKGKGKISFWDNIINENTGTFKLQAVFENPDRKLVPGMFTRIHLEPEAVTDKLTIPLVAIMTDQAGDYVYVVDKDNTVSRRTIKTGFKDEKNVIVTDKLKEGEVIVVNGLQKTRPGAKVTPKNVDDAKKAETTTPAETKSAEATTSGVTK